MLETIALIYLYGMGPAIIIGSLVYAFGAGPHNFRQRNRLAGLAWIWPIMVLVLLADLIRYFIRAIRG